MAADNEKLWIVRRYNNSVNRSPTTKTYVFRTRDAARNFVANVRDNPRTKATYTAPLVATWGPES